jgi:hypothetical protein
VDENKEWTGFWPCRQIGSCASTASKFQLSNALGVHVDGVSGRESCRYEIAATKFSVRVEGGLWKPTEGQTVSFVTVGIGSAWATAEI